MKDLPPPIAGRYQQALENREELLKLYDDIALLDTRIAELCQQLESGERSTVWDDLQALAWDAEQPGAELAAILPTLQSIAAKGKQTIQAWRDIEAMIHSKAKIVAIEGRRQSDMGEIMTKAEMHVWVIQFSSVIREAANEAIPDTAARDAFLLHASRGLMQVLKGPRQGAGDVPTPAPPTHPLAEMEPVQIESEANPTSSPPDAPDAG